MEVGAPRRHVFVGVDAGARAEAPLEGSGFPTDEEARAQGYRDAKDWYSRALAPSLRGTPALEVEAKMLEANATRGFPEETAETEYESAGGEADSVQVIGQHEQESREPGAYDPTVRVPGSPPGPVEIRPFLLRAWNETKV